ncbi:hypothetical protein DI43_17055 [Geobacillus sp. CAMR12739]|nr:hypothetical protein DI43_17055 [Geobacillus sp. CAMR12739]
MEDIRKQGYVRVRIDGEMRELTEDIELEKTKNIRLMSSSTASSSKTASPPGLPIRLRRR